MHLLRMRHRQHPTRRQNARNSQLHLHRQTLSCPPHPRSLNNNSNSRHQGDTEAHRPWLSLPTHRLITTFLSQLRPDHTTHPWACPTHPMEATVDHRPHLLQDTRTSTGADPPDSQHNRHPHLSPRQDHHRLRLPLKEGRTSKYTPRGGILCLFPFFLCFCDGIIFFLFWITICSKTQQPKFTCSTIHTHTHVVSFLFFSLATYLKKKSLKSMHFFLVQKNIPTVHTCVRLHGWDRNFANGTVQISAQEKETHGWVQFRATPMSK